MQGGCSFVYFQPDLLPDEPVGDRFLTADGQHDSST